MTFNATTRAPAPLERQQLSRDAICKIVIAPQAPYSLATGEAEPKLENYSAPTHFTADKALAGKCFKFARAKAQ